jgi:hypothetical protein
MSLRMSGKEVDELILADQENFQKLDTVKKSVS